MEAVKRYIKETDKGLLLLCLCASCFSLLILTSIAYFFYDSYSIVIVQAAATVLGVIVALVVSSVDYRLLANLWKVHVPITVGLVILTFFFGITPAGTDDKAWLPLFAGLTIQPSELLKISFILTFALHLEKVKEHLNQITTLLLLIVHGAFPVLLIHLQGDDGTALVFAAIFLFMLFAAGLSWKYIIAGLGAIAVAVPIIWFKVMSPHQQERLLNVFFPERDPKGVGWQPMQGRISLGSGMIWGKGLFSGEHRSIPAMQNDFIFAYIGQALGFVGCITALAIIVAICIKVLLIIRRSKDDLGRFICVGVFAVFSFQSIINIGMSLSVIPVIGITLPLFSSGGTSLVLSYMLIGLAMSVFRHNKTLLFE